MIKIAFSTRNNLSRKKQPYNEASKPLEKEIEMDESHLGARIKSGMIATRSEDLLVLFGI